MASLWPLTQGTRLAGLSQEVGEGSKVMNLRHVVALLNPVREGRVDTLSPSRGSPMAATMSHWLNSPSQPGSFEHCLVKDSRK